MTERKLVEEGLAALGIRNFVFAIHDASHPSLAGQDAGRGSPYSEGAARFVAFLRKLGFGALQFGPQGITSSFNASPYDGTLFSKEPLSIDLWQLSQQAAWAPFIQPESLEVLARDCPDREGSRAQLAYAHRAQKAALSATFRNFVSAPKKTAAPLNALLQEFERRNAGWLEKEALYFPLAETHGEWDWRKWRSAQGQRDALLWNPSPGGEAEASSRRASLRKQFSNQLSEFLFVQTAVHAQHEAFQRMACAAGLMLYADFQVGISAVDTWGTGDLFLKHYLMGAPPSRTNPLGQPWGYPVFNPGAEPVHFLQARVSKLLCEFDNLRIDHPHGLVCPWVYRADEADPLMAVQSGARLFESPNLRDHPALVRYAIARAEQLNPSAPRHADGWVRELSEEQVVRYASLLDVVIHRLSASGRSAAGLACEILSTCPYPLQLVLSRHGLGRFRVTQKVNLADPKDVYRSENAAEADWMMVGTHDTPPLWLVMKKWEAQGRRRAHADYLASRLAASTPERERLARSFAESLGSLAQAKFAELFAGRAQNVSVFFTDLLGMEEAYNLPGAVNDSNWTLRVPRLYETYYSERLSRNEAMNIPWALFLALQAKGALSDGRRELALALAEKGRALSNRALPGDF